MAATASTRIGASGRSRALVRGVGRYFLGIFEWCLHWKTKGSAARVAGRLRSVSVLFGRSERRTVSHIKKLQANEGFAGGGRIGGSRKRRKQADGQTGTPPRAQPGEMDLRPSARAQWAEWLRLRAARPAPPH